MSFESAVTGSVEIPTETENSKRLSFIFSVLQGRYPNIVTIEDGLNRAACERDAWMQACQRAVDFIESHVADPDITWRMRRNYEAYKLAQDGLKKFLSENVGRLSAAESFPDEGKKAK